MQFRNTPLAMALVSTALLSATPVHQAMAQLDCNAANVTCSGDVYDGASPTAGDTGTGSIVVDGGSVSGTDRVSTADSTSGNGTIVVRSGAQWDNDQNFHAGFLGTGNFEFTGAGTRVSTYHDDTSGVCPCPSGAGDRPGATGTITVSDQAEFNVVDGPGFGDSNGELIIGQEGVGNMQVNTAAAVNANSLLFGRIAGGIGNGTIDGSGTVVTSNSTLRLSEQVNTNSTVIIQNGAEVVIKGDTDFHSSGWQEASVMVGEEGTATMNITSGGNLTINRGGAFSLGTPNGMLIGGTNAPTSNPGIGSVTVDGAGSSIDITGGKARLVIGNGEVGQGTLTIANGGAVNLDNSAAGDFTEVLVATWNAGNSGDLLVDGAGSQLNAGSQINCGSGGAGNMMVKDSGVANADGINIGPNCIARGNGSYNGSSYVEGQLLPGTNVPGSLHVGGNVDLYAGGLVQFEVLSTNPSNQDALNADNIVWFNQGSTCEIILDDSTVTLAQLSTMQLINAPSVGGTADVVVKNLSNVELARVNDADISTAGGCAAVLADDGGTTIEALCPCDGPVGGGNWKNHGKYVSCVSHAAGDLVNLGELDASEIGSVVSAAARSSCGKK